MAIPLLEKNHTIPYICTPLTGKNESELVNQLEKIVTKKPDLVEWRVDFFAKISDQRAVFQALETIHQNSNGIPLLFTIRSKKEGGQEIPLDEQAVVELIAAICKSNCVNLVDFELNSQPEHINYIREISQKWEKKLILSYHNFEQTPTKEQILSFIKRMEQLGADAAKIAVMPRNKEDVFTLLDVTKEANTLFNIPIITMSMSKLGAISRIIGWYYGSCLTFAVGDQSSAPGQIPIEQLRHMIEMLKKQVNE